MDSPEYKTLTQCYPRLFTCVQQSPNDVVTRLRSSEILAPEDLSFLDNPLSNKNQKAGRILGAVLTQVEIDPRVFRIFVSALEAAGPWTKTIVSELNHLCTSLSATMSMPQTPLHVDTTIHTQASQIPASTDHESDNQAGRDLYKVISQAESIVSDIEFNKTEGILEQETRHMRWKFAGLIRKVIASIKETKVEVKTLATFLQQIDPIDATLVTAKHSCLFFTAEVVKSIESGDIDNVFRELKHYYSWFNFDLVEGIIDEFCKDDDDVNAKLSEYKEQMRKYCENRLCEFSNCLEDRDDYKLCVFKIDKEWRTMRFSELETIETIICNILKLNRVTLVLQAVGKGCVELTFSIPKQVVEVVFPSVSVAEVEELEKQGIRFCEKSSPLFGSTDAMREQREKHKMASSSATTSINQSTESLASTEDQLDQLSRPKRRRLMASPAAAAAPTPKPVPDKSVFPYDWKAGDHCKAIWPDNGEYCSAVIEMVSVDGENCSVKFDSYGTSTMTKLSELRPLSWDKEASDKPTEKCVKQPMTRQVRAEMRECKKQKAQKKRMKIVEEFPEKKKGPVKAFIKKTGTPSQKVTPPSHVPSYPHSPKSRTKRVEEFPEEDKEPGQAFIKKKWTKRLEEFRKKEKGPGQTFARKTGTSSPKVTPPSHVPSYPHSSKSRTKRVEEFPEEDKEPGQAFIKKRQIHMHWHDVKPLKRPKLCRTPPLEKH